MPAHVAGHRVAGADLFEGQLGRAGVQLWVVVRMYEPLALGVDARLLVGVRGMAGTR
jgi:hypothetical protein